MKVPAALLLTLLLLATNANGQKFDSTYGKPLIVFVTSRFEIPQLDFILYEKGQLIYQKLSSTHYEFFQIVLNPQQRDSLISSFNIPDDIYKLDTIVSVLRFPDITTIEVNIKQHKKIYSYSSHTLSDTLKENISAIKIFRTVYDSLWKFYNNLNSTNTQEWIPNKFHVGLEPCPNRNTPRLWPTDLPDLYAPTTVRNKNWPDIYDLLIDKGQFSEIKNLYGDGSTPVRIDGQIMCMSYYFLLPNLWW